MSVKKFIVNNCMKYIKKNTNHDDIKLKEIEYGLVSIYLSISKFIFISLVALFLGIFKEMIIFTLLFNIIRLPAFGLHATKSWICLLSSTFLFIMVPILCIYLNLNNFSIVFICLVCMLLILKNAPADTYKRPIVSKKRRTIYKILSTVIAIVFSISAIIINDNFLSNCFVFALILENILISPTTYKIFKLPYNNYITFLKEHPNFEK